jgi:hypothetical protein
MRAKGSIAAPVIAILLAGGGGCRRLVCDDVVNAEQVAPDGQHVAASLERNCGATTRFTTYVTISSQRGKYPDDLKDAVLALAGRVPVKMSWTDKNTLVLALPAAAEKKVMRKRTRFEHLQVQLTFDPPN